MWLALSDGLSILIKEWSVVLGSLFVVCLGYSLIFFIPKGAYQEKTYFQRNAILLGGFFAVSLLLRLAFLKEVFVPPYFDSVEHYRITKQLVTALESSFFWETLPTLTRNFYHRGFHFLASFLAFGLRADPMDVILVLGQVLLAAIPIPVFFLIRNVTKSDMAGIFGMLLAGFGWYMPGFAVNWGKYPALAGLWALEFVLITAYSISHKQPYKNQPLLVGWLILGIIVSALFHTRALVVIAISVLSWIAAGKISILHKTFQYLSLGALLAGILALGIFIKGEPLLDLVLDPYLNDGLFVTLVVLALSPFALVKFSQGFSFSFLFVFCVFASLFIPAGFRSPGLENQTLLDRPFAEMVLYLPLSILGGLGLAGLLKSFPSFRAFPEKTRWSSRVLTTVLLVGSTGWVAFSNYDFYPSDCCNFVGYDDAVALDWLDKNLPPDARILAAATQMHVLPSGPAANLVGTDAGIWIRAMTGRNIWLASYEIDFRSASTLKWLCRMQFEYIYVGGKDQSFDAQQLQDKAKWYGKVLFLPDAQLYRLRGCSE